MAAVGNIAWVNSVPAPVTHLERKNSQLPEFAGVFRGRELTRKDRRIVSGLHSIDGLIDGGIIRGRISEIIAEPGAGKTSLASAFAASVTRREAAAWIEASDEFDPASVAATGVELARLLWVSCRQPTLRRRSTHVGDDHRAAASRFHVIPPTQAKAAQAKACAHGLKAAEWILAAGGFGLVILDFGMIAYQLPQSSALRLARAAERSGAAVLVLAPRRMCGTFAALSLTLRRERVCFSRSRPGGPVLFSGLNLEARVARNKLGGSGQIAKWQTVIEVGPAFQPVKTTSWKGCPTLSTLIAAEHQLGQVSHELRMPR
jgi:hypothetical protein